MTVGETIELDLQTLVHGGDALGRLDDGRAVFVPYGLPGERVRARLTEQKRGFARAELLEVLRPSPDRLDIPAEQLAECGGCDFIHLNYPAQLRYKTEILRDQLQRIAGISDPPVAPIIASPQEWHYRNAVQFHLAQDGRLGFQRPGSHSVVPISHCRLCQPVINEVLPQLDFSDEDGRAVPGLVRVQVRAGAGDEILLVLESADPAPPEFTVDLEISAVFYGPGGPQENQALILAGDDHLVMEALGRAFKVSAGSFFQVNTAQAENMLRYLLEIVPPSVDEVLEVYAGVGLFSAFLAPRAGRLVAVESAPAAVDDFATNLDEFDHIELYDGQAEEVLPALELHPGLALVDPPRAGLALPALDALVRMQSPALVYISCDPATLARDAKRLLAAGYRLDSSQPFDMFPQTHHIESVNLFLKD